MNRHSSGVKHFLKGVKKNLGRFTSIKFATGCGRED